ncbi:MAG: aldo/keto reductase [Eubacteriales bacterium]
MRYDFLGKSNLEVSKVCLGTMHFGNRTPDDEAFKIMDKALDMGINFFDTANVYGSPKGRTEEVIGNWFAQSGKRNRVILASKSYESMHMDVAPANEGYGTSAYQLKRDMEASLKRLQTDHVDLYQAHHIDRRVTVEEFWNGMEKLIDRDYTTYIGTSNFPGWGLAKFQSAAMQRGNIGIVSEQTMYNLLCRYPEMEVIPAAMEYGIGLLPYMPLAGGLLTGKTSATAGFRTNQVAGEYNISYEEDNAIAKFNKFCAEIGEKPANVAGAWVLANPAVSSVVVGVRTLEQLDDLERMSELILDKEAIDTLNDIFPISQGRVLRNNLPTPECYAW